MKLPLGFGELDFSDWLRGLLAAFITGGSSAVVSGVVVTANDPQHYALGTVKFFEVVGSVFLVSGTLNMFSFLRTKPLPELKVVTTTVQKTEPLRPSGTVVTTVAETHTEPISPDGPKATT